MPDYEVADGHDNEAGYSTIAPQPRCKGIQYPEYVVAASGDVIPRGDPFVDLEWRGLITAAEYSAILTSFGLTTDTTNDVTISLPDAGRSTFSDYNGKAVHQRTKDYVEFERGFYRNVRITVKELAGT